MANTVEKPVVLIVVDGFGLAEPSHGNAITLASTPNWDMLAETYPWVATEASGVHVGLPEGVMGNSEVGHLTIGTGRVTYQSLERINRAFEENRIASLPEFLQLLDAAKQGSGTLHLMGLVSDGKVHSDLDHLFHLITLLHGKVTKIYIHAFTDGRDTPTDSSIEYLKQLDDHCMRFDNVKLASVMGRYYAMDRDKKWERTKIAYDSLVNGTGEITTDTTATIKSRYSEGETDEFLKPIIVVEEGRIRNGDAVFFFNFRPDRARQITQALVYEVDFETEDLSDIYYSSMTRYDEDWDFPVLLDNPKINNSLAEVVSNFGLRQAHVAETEKYAHVTYFLNGGLEDQFPGEDRILVPSPRIETYDLQPEMSTLEITAKTVECIKSKEYSLIVLNIACPDMVGHTGIIPATVQAVEAMDAAFGKIYDVCLEFGYTLAITSDHGNAEKMLDGEEVHTAHTTNKVPFLIADTDVHLGNNAGLKNVAPTLLTYMGIPVPESMDGGSLLR